MECGAFLDCHDRLRSIAIGASERVLHERALSEDVAQEALLRTLRRWDEVGAYGDRWIARVARNLALDEWRRKRPELPGDLDLAAQPAACSVAARLDLKAAVKRLPPRQREAIECRFSHGLTVDETARRMGIGTAGVLKHSQRAFETLRHGTLGATV